jgi:hypothetical protein
VHLIMQEALAVVVDALHLYLLPVRFYSRYYPYMGFKNAMVHIALERTRQVSPCPYALAAARMSSAWGCPLQSLRASSTPACRCGALIRALIPWKQRL